MSSYGPLLPTCPVDEQPGLVALIYTGGSGFVRNLVALNLQTVLIERSRKDGPASVEFYTKHLGMTLLRKLDFPQWKFSLCPGMQEASPDAFAAERRHKQGVCNWRGLISWLDGFTASCVEQRLPKLAVLALASHFV